MITTFQPTALRELGYSTISVRINSEPGVTKAKPQSETIISETAVIDGEEWTAIVRFDEGLSAEDEASARSALHEALMQSE